MIGPRAVRIIVALAFGLISVLLIMLILRGAGFPVRLSVLALLRGAFGSPDAIVSSTLVRTTPLLLSGLAVTLAFRAGVMNIGAEGQLLAGASAATAVGVYLPDVLGVFTVPVELAAAAFAGGAWSSIPAWLRARFGVLEVISTIMMNFLGLHLVSYLVRGPIQEPTHIYPQSPSIPALAQLPVAIAGSRLHWGFLLAILMAVLLGVCLRYSAIGFRVDVVGLNPAAALSAGRIDVPTLTTRVFLVSGAIAGLAGGVELTGVTYALYDNFSPGYGYSAIAVSLLAALRPEWVIASAIVFGALDAGAASMQRDAGVPSGFVGFLQAVIMVLLLAGPLVTRRLSTAWRPRQSDAVTSSP